MAGWINARQLERDHRGLRNACCICGHEGTTRHPLIVDSEGNRIHKQVHDDQLCRATCSIFVGLAAQRYQRRQEAQPTHHTHTTGTTTGGTMSSVDELRANLASTNQQSEGVHGALQEALRQVEEIQARLQQAVGSSSNDTIRQAMELYAQIPNTINELAGMLHAARTQVDAYSANLL